MGGGGRAECGLELYHVFYSGTCLKSLKNDFVTFIRAVVYLVTFFFILGYVLYGILMHCDFVAN